MSVWNPTSSSPWRSDCAPRLRRASDGSNDCADWDTEANGLSALARRIEGYADALDPITARDERGGAKARYGPSARTVCETLERDRAIDRDQ